MVWALRRLRDRSMPIREMQQAAVGASRMATSLTLGGNAGLKRLSLAVLVGAFLAFVGAFDGGQIAPLPRYTLYIALSLICFGIASLVVAGVRHLPVLRQRPRLTHVSSWLVTATVTGITVWTIAGFFVFGAPRPGQFAAYMEMAMGITLAHVAPDAPGAPRPGAPPPAAAAIVPATPTAEAARRRTLCCRGTRSLSASSHVHGIDDDPVAIDGRHERTRRIGRRTGSSFMVGGAQRGNRSRPQSRQSGAAIEKRRDRTG